MIPNETVAKWAQYLYAAGYSAATIKRYCSAVRHFLAWHEDQEQRPNAFADLTPIALMGYRQALQQHRTSATTNLHVAALRAWSQWLNECSLLDENPAERLKSVGHVKPDAPISLSAREVNALLRAARRSRYGKRNYAICQ